MSINKKVAFVGKSSPIAYDYNNTDRREHPNPILESPLSLQLLYDEIWFLSEGVCPQNMRGLDFVKFVSDAADLNLQEHESELLLFHRKQEYKLQELLDTSRVQTRALNITKGTLPSFDQWNRVVDSIVPFADCSLHGCNALLPENYTNIDLWDPSPKFIDLIHDLYIMSQISRPLHYVSNFAIDTQLPSHFVDKVVPKSRSVDKLLLGPVINCQRPSGPYFNKIDEFREYDTIQDFRKKVWNQKENSTDSLIQDFNKIRNEILISATDQWNIYEGAILLISNFIPVMSSILGIASDGRDIIQSIRRNREYKWAKFVSQVQQDLNYIKEGET